MGFSYKKGIANKTCIDAQIDICLIVPDMPWVKMYAINRAGAKSKIFILIDTAKLKKIISILR